MKNIRYIILITVILMYSCSSLKIEKIDANSEINKAGFIYALPQTEIQIKFNITKTNYIKGPFFEYSKEYLGINNVIKENSTEYKISSIDISTKLENDTSQMYLISGKSKGFQSFQYFDNTLVLKSVNIINNEPKQTKNNKYYIPVDETENINFIPFKDITIRPLVIEKNDTIWKNILVDSVYKRVPKINKAIAPSTIKDQAFNASKFIFKIRKRRLRILAGMDEKFPKGDALKKIIKELDELENSYIELFTGKTISDTINYNFSFVPNEYSTEFTLNFDNKIGFNENANNEIKISIVKTKENKALINFSNKEKTSNLFTYRIPENAELIISSNNKRIYNTNIEVSQFGYLNYLNKNTLNKKVLFNSNTGNLLYIK